MTICCIDRGCKPCLTRRSRAFHPRQTFGPKVRSRVLPGLAIAIAFLSVGYVFSEPLRGQGTKTSVARIYGRMLEQTQAWLHRPSASDAPAPPVQMAENDDDQQSAHPGRAVGRIRVTPVRDPFQNAGAKPAAAPQPIQVEARPANQQPAAATSAVRIPDSLSNPVQSASMRSVARDCAVASRRPRARVPVRGPFSPVAAAESSAQLSRTGGQGALAGSGRAAGMDWPGRHHSGPEAGARIFPSWPGRVSSREAVALPALSGQRPRRRGRNLRHG